MPFTRVSNRIPGQAAPEFITKGGLVGHAFVAALQHSPPTLAAGGRRLVVEFYTIALARTKERIGLRHLTSSARCVGSARTPPLRSRQGKTIVLNLCFAP